METAVAVRVRPGRHPVQTGVAHVPVNSAACEHQAAAGTRRRPQEALLEAFTQAAAVETDPTECTRCVQQGLAVNRSWCWLQFRRQSPRFVAAPSRRQPFRSASGDQCDESVERSIKFSRSFHVEFTAASAGLTVHGTGRQHPFSGAVSDHVAGRSLAGQTTISGDRSRHGTVVGDASGSGATRRAAQSAARRRRAATWTTIGSCRTRSPRVALVDQDASSIRVNPGGTPRAEGVFPSAFREQLRIAELAARTHLRAAPHWIPGCVRPLNRPTGRSFGAVYKQRLTGEVTRHAPDDCRPNKRVSANIRSSVANIDPCA